MDFFRPIEPAIPMKPKSPRDWANLVIVQSNDLALRQMAHARALGKPFLQSPQLRIQAPIRGLVVELYGEQLRMLNEPLAAQVSSRAFNRKHNFFAERVKEAKRHNPKTVLSYMVSTLLTSADSLVEVSSKLDPDEAKGQKFAITELLKSSLMTFYLMMCSSERFIVGTGDNTLLTKNIKIPVLIGEDEEASAPLFYTAANYLNFVNYFGREDAPVIPEMLVHPRQLHLLKAPNLPAEIAHYLQSAYFNPRFLFPLEGAQFDLKNMGNVNGMFMLKGKEWIVANVGTRLGNLLVGINLDSAKVVEPQRIVSPDYEDDSKYPASPIARLVAASYHHLVVAKVISDTAPRELAPPNTIRWKAPKEGVKKQPEVTIKIPRVYREGVSRDKEPRQFYTERKPVEPHKVIMHKRRTPKNGISNGQARKVREFKERYNCDLPKYDPAIETIVLGHIVPREAELEDRFPKYVWDGLWADAEQKIT